MVEQAVDIGILTIRDDEFRAVLAAFPDDHTVYKGRHREYTLRTAYAGQAARYRLGIVRQIEQGNGEAQEAARDLVDDLQPSLILVVGIAGGLPSDDVTLGDVVLSTRILDFSVEARKFQENPVYNVGGGPIAKSIAAGVANLSAREAELGDWWEELPAKPAVSFSKVKLYGPKDWQRLVKEKLQVHYGKKVAGRPPIFSAGSIASSDRLVKDPKVLFPWITTARGILAIEMESAGVHRGTRDKTPMLAIRGLSDIVGLKRHDAWTKYACAAAAAFARAYLRTRPVSVRERPKSDVSGDAAHRDGSGEHRDEQAVEVEEGFANLIPLRHFPEVLHIGPALCKTRKQGWALLNQGVSGRSAEYVPGAWILYEENLYSLADPERSRLKKIVDWGGLDQFETREWAFSEDENKRRLFVRLLNAALREDLWSQGVRYHPDQDVYAFTGDSDAPPRRLRYPNLKLRSTVTVVSHYESKPKKGKKPFQYLRHNAFQGRFRLLGGQWYLEITPTYRFTRNGKDLELFHEQHLAGIKRIERNRSVLSQLLMWQAVLRAPWKPADRARLLEFAPLVSFSFSSGIDESSLTALNVPSVRPSRDEEVG